MFRKVLVANRGEIAIRAFRAAYELGIATVAVFPYEDRNSLHRAKADESYQIGEVGPPGPRVPLGRRGDQGGPPGGRRRGLPRLRLPLREPRPRAGLRRGGHHVRRAARRRAAPDRQQGPRDRRGPGGGRRRCCAPARPSTDVDALVAAADDIGFPIFVKAVAGGGGRGMRRVERAEDLRDAIDAAMREAESAFGDATVFLEQAVVNPRHIEVQILADADGQRRAPLRARLLDAAPPPEGDRDRARAQPRPRAAGPDLRRRRRVRQAIGYVNAGTVEFLLDERGNHVFIEMNPRIQVEHTVTEQVTDRDLVIAQLRIAAGMTLPELRPHPGPGDALRRRAAVPGHHRGPGQRVPPGHRRDQRLPLAGRPRRPARRRHDAHRRRGQRALRLDAGQAHLLRPRLRAGRPAGPPGDRGVPHPRRRDEPAVPGRRARRPRLPGGPRHHELHRRAPAACCAPASPPTAAPGCSPTSPRRRSTGRTAVGPQVVEPVDKLPALDLGAGRRRRLPAAPARAGPGGVRPAAAGADRRSPSPTRRSATPTSRCSPPGCAPATCSPSPRYVARTAPQLLSLECWGGATYDVALRFLAEDPWERLAALSEAVPNICLQMLLRGRNTVGYTPYPTEVTDAFVHEAAATGHRHLPDLRRAQRRRADAARDRRRAGHRHGRRRGGALLHRRPVRPGGGPLHARLLPAPRRADRRRGRARAGDQGHGRAAAAARRPHAGHGAARALRPAGAPAHPRHRGRPARHAHRRDRGGRGRRRRGGGVDGGHHVAALAVGAGGGHRPHRARHRAVAAGGRRPGAVLGGGAQGLPAVRVRARVAHRPRLPPRDPRRAAVQPAPAGHRAGAGRPVRADRGPATPPPTGCSDGW